MYDDIIWIYSFSGTYLLPLNYLNKISKKFKISPIIFDEWRCLILDKIKNKTCNLPSSPESNVNFIIY